MGELLPRSSAGGFVAMLAITVDESHNGLGAYSNYYANFGKFHLARSYGNPPASVYAYTTWAGVYQTAVYSVGRVVNRYYLTNVCVPHSVRVW